jgi:hypothetical protein
MELQKPDQTPGLLALDGEEGHYFHRIPFGSHQASPPVFYKFLFCFVLSFFFFVSDTVSFPKDWEGFNSLMFCRNSRP